jgi:hypothetical protein
LIFALRRFLIEPISDCEWNKRNLAQCQLKIFAQQFRRTLFDHDFGFKIEADGKSEILMRRARVAINAAVLAAAIRIQARIVSNRRFAVPRTETNAPDAACLWRIYTMTAR